MDLKTIIKKPLITEKTMRGGQANRYTFMVDKKATKGQIKEAIKKFLKVEPIKVWTLRVGSSQHWAPGRKRKIITPGFKKAIVELKKGQKLDFYESMTDKK